MSVGELLPTRDNGFVTRQVWDYDLFLLLVLLLLPQLAGTDNSRLAMDLRVVLSSKEGGLLELLLLAIFDCDTDEDSRADDN